MIPSPAKKSDPDTSPSFSREEFAFKRRLPLEQVESFLENCLSSGQTERGARQYLKTRQENGYFARTADEDTYTWLEVSPKTTADAEYEKIPHNECPECGRYQYRQRKHIMEVSIGIHESGTQVETYSRCESCQFESEHQRYTENNGIEIIDPE